MQRFWAVTVVWNKILHIIRAAGYDLVSVYPNNVFSMLFEKGGCLLWPSCKLQWILNSPCLDKLRLTDLQILVGLVFVLGFAKIFSFT